MPLTNEEEGKVRQVIRAFEEGKTINQLPECRNLNPFDLFTEVVDNSGKSQKATLIKMLPYVEDNCAYGIEWDTTVSSPTCARIGSVNLHKTLPIQNRMRGCLLNDNGTVQQYLTSWTGADRSGAKGQVMVEVPEHYRKVVEDGNKRRCLISEYPIPGYIYVPKFYISAYEATVQRSANKLCSVVNSTTDYRGGANQADWDSLPKSVLGKPATSVSRTNFRKYARARNMEATAEWNCQTYEEYKAITWLFFIEYATFNSQAPFNPNKDANGYSQGGLGDGPTTLTSEQWTTFNAIHPFLPCGYTDEFANKSGEKAYTLPGTSIVVKANRYRGIENPFGHIWKWTDGINIDIKTDGEGGQSKIYVAKDPEAFNDTNYNGYQMRGLEARTNGYVKEFILGIYADIMPMLVGGSSTTYMSDNHYTDVSTSSLRGVRFGGIAYVAANAGFACADSLNVPSTADSSIGSRLCFLPRNA